MQKRYWSFMTNSKFSILYIELHFSNCIKNNRILRIIMAIASCSSIAAWAIWKELSFIWGIIIAISQVIGAINEFLPYQKRIEELSSLKSEWSLLYISIEKNWLSVSSGNLTEDEINTLLYEYEQKWDEIDNKYLKDDVLPQKNKFIERAEKIYNNYFENKFGG